MRETTKETKVVKSNHRPSNWKDTRFWKDDQLWVHPVALNEPDPLPIHGKIPDWVYLRRNQDPPRLEEKSYEQLLAEGYNTTDLGNAERLILHYRSILHYCSDYKCWLIWDSGHWDRDTGAKIANLARFTIRKIYQEASDEPDKEKRKELVNHGMRSEAEHHFNAMIHFAESEPGIPVRAHDLDSDQWLFNVSNGTINLKTGELLKHDPADLLTIIVPIDYDPEAKCPLWLSFLDQVTSGDAELVEYLQRAVGYSLTGDTKSQALFLLYGLGSNGKSTFTMLIRRLMGNYGERLDADDLMLKDKRFGGGPKEGIANLRNKRYVVGSELQDGRRLDVSLIKDMTGGETIKGRRLYEHEIEFMPTYKLWLYGNHKPVIGDSTLSIWRRMKQISFNVTIPERDIDPDLPSKLEAELPGILAWAVKGCLDWQEHGLREPAAVTSATANYRHDQDILGDFIEDCCILEILATIPKSDLKDLYGKWCQDNSIEPVTQKTFKARLVEKGITEGRIGKSRYWRGIRGRTEADDKSDKALGDLATNVTRPNDLHVSPLVKGIQEDLHVNSVKDVTSKLREKSLVTKVSENEAIAEYPTHPCRCGGDDYWLTEDNRWLCSRCHPKPEGGSND